MFCEWFDVIFMVFIVEDILFMCEMMMDVVVKMMSVAFSFSSGDEALVKIDILRECKIFDSVLMLFDIVYVFEYDFVKDCVLNEVCVKILYIWGLCCAFVSCLLNDGVEVELSCVFDGKICVNFDVCMIIVFFMFCWSVMIEDKLLVWIIVGVFVVDGFVV